MPQLEELRKEEEALMIRCLQWLHLDDLRGLSRYSWVFRESSIFPTPLASDYNVSRPEVKPRKSGLLASDM